MKFSTASAVLGTLQAGDEAARVQGENRVIINNLFNGEPTLSDTDADNMHVEINVNFGEAPVLGQHGRRQYYNNFASRQNYFKISLPDAPPEKSSDWASFITRKVNRYLRKSRQYVELQRSQWASVLLHGIAPKLWYNRHDPIPKYVALADFRVPTDSLCSMENVTWFGVRKYYTEGELARTVWGKYADEGWKKDAIKGILANYHDESPSQDSQNHWLIDPEKMAEVVKQNGGLYSSDAVPTIPLWHFFYLDDDNPRKSSWKLCVVPDQNLLGGPYEDFVYQSDEPYAQKLDHFLHVQFGDLNNDAPFKIHSVRSLGFLIMEPVFWSNLLQCRSLQHLLEHMNAWLRITDPAGRARAQKIDLFHEAILEEGVSVVPENERHNINPALLEMVQGKLKELQNEASVSYTQDTEGRQDNETATGVMARVSAVSAMMSGLIATATTYEEFADEEICRRLCLSRSPNEDVRRFQKECADFGIPRQFINVEYWEIQRQTPIGDGNPTMEMAKAKQLLEMRPMYSPTAQQEILHEATVAFADERRADKWVPLGKLKTESSGQQHAEVAFSTLMLGVPVTPIEGLPLIDQISTMIGSIAGVIQRIEKTGNMARPDEIIGLQNAAQYTSNLIEQLGQDEAEKPKAKEFGDVLGKLMNSVKGFMQRLQQQAAQNGNGNGDGGAAAKEQAQIILAHSKAQISEQKANQTQRHKEIAFQSEQKRQDAKAFADIQREGAKTHEDLIRKRYAAFNSPKKSSSE